jgi:hypothetical protein
VTLKLKMQGRLQHAANWEVDRARHDWLFHPAQTVACTQIYWTEETGDVSGDLAGGARGCCEEVISRCVDGRLQELIACARYRE